MSLHLTPDVSSVSKFIGKQSNLHYLFEKVTQIFNCKFISQIKQCVTLLLEKSNHIISRITCNTDGKYPEPL